MARAAYPAAPAGSAPTTWRGSFPYGPGGVCHPHNVGGFNLHHPACAPLYKERWASLERQPGWEEEVLGHARLSREGWNCSSVQACALGQMFLMLDSYGTPGFYGYPHQKPVRADRWRLRLWLRMAQRARSAQWRELRALLSERMRELAAAAAADGDPGVRPGDITLGVHADPLSAKGEWRSQVEFWRGYAAVHGLRFLLDQENYFDGKVFAQYMGLHWASSDETKNGFWVQYDFLMPNPSLQPQGRYPSGPFYEASLTDRRLLEGLAVFDQAPVYWDSLDALRDAVTENRWTVWMDYDLTMSPCCFDVFSFRDLIVGGAHIRGQGAAGRAPHLILRDSPREDYSHHCANAGFQVVRNSAIGRLYIELAERKRPWPRIPYGYQGALAESLLELLGFEWVVSGRSEHPAYSSQCAPHLVLGTPMGSLSYANFCHCYRTELARLAGPKGARTSQWVRFLDSKRGPETGLLMASLFLFRATAEPPAGPSGRGGARGAGFLPLTTWSRERHRSYADAWMPGDAEVGGPCALLPLLVHWASLPHRPRLMHRFLHARFPEELPLPLLANGSATELAAAYRRAGARGRAAWMQFLARRSPKHAWLRVGNSSSRLTRACCNLGSERMWRIGGYRRKAHSTADNAR